MRRLWVVLVLACFVFVALDVTVEVVWACAADCAGDDVDAGCALDFCCSCCVHLRFDPPRSPFAVEWESGGPRLVAPSAAQPSSPDPPEIFHVPKPHSV